MEKTDDSRSGGGGVEESTEGASAALDEAASFDAAAFRDCFFPGHAGIAKV